MCACNGAPLAPALESVALPAAFFRELLPAIDDLAELKLTIFCLAALGQKEGDFRYLRIREFIADASLMRGLAGADESATAREALDRALAKALARGTLLTAEVEEACETERYYLAADESGKQLQRRIQAGEWRRSADGDIELLPARPSVYALYEENIGVLTPMIAESLKEAQASYPIEWIEEAMRYAVERNARSWRYIRKVLEAWQQEGRSREESERHPGGPRKYTSGKRKNFIKS